MKSIIHPDAKIGYNFKIGYGSIILKNAIIGNNVEVGNNCIIGEGIEALENFSQANQTIIGDNSVIRSSTIIYHSCKIGDSFMTGHFVTVREMSSIGSHVLIGSHSDIQGYCEIKDYARLHSNVSVCHNSSIGRYVFIYPNVVLTNDSTPPSEFHVGPIIGDFSQVASSAVLLPGTKIGQHCLIGALSLVKGTIPDDSLIMGNPAKKIATLSKAMIVNQEGQVHYPWPKNFKRGMPWEKTGYEKWLTEQK